MLALKKSTLLSRVRHPATHARPLTVIKESIDSVDVKVAALNAAQNKFLDYDQKAVDRIFCEVAHSVAKQRVYLARLAFEETKMGCLEDKVIKNAVAAELTLSKYRDLKTCGIIEYDRVKKITKIAVPVGPIAAILPTTNPTSTVITKGLFALKTRNAMLFVPHPRATFATQEAVRIMHEAAVAAGAPEGILQSVTASKEISDYVMHHKGIRLLLATGGPAMVSACYKSGKPALGVGAGNAAVIIDETADLEDAVGSICLSKTFDNGMICASEQSVVIIDSVYDRTIQHFKNRGVHFVEGEEKKRLGQYLIQHGSINADIVGKSANTIASRLSIAVPPKTIVLAAECTEIGDHEPLSSEKLSPLLSIYRAKDFADSVDISRRIVSHGGWGHSSAIYTTNRKRVEDWAKIVPAFHLMVNMPTALGAIGSSFNFHVDPSLTLGVGSMGGSSLSGSLTPQHLMDTKIVAEKQTHMEWIKNPPALYFNRNCTEEALEDLVNDDRKLKRCLIISDKIMSQLGHVERVSNYLHQRGFAIHVFDDVCPDPDMNCIRAGVRVCNEFKPDVMICLGGGSPMDAGKFIRVQYEHPEITIGDLAARFIELRKRTQEFPNHGSKIRTMVCIPTTSGTASEVTPFSVVTDDDGRKHPLFSYQLTPDIAIVDSSYTDNLPKSLVAYAGLDAITHAVESYVSVVANDFTMPSSLRSLKMLFANLKNSFDTGDITSREKVHHGATIAGLAFSNAFLGICHSLSHKVGAKFHLPHGLTNAVLLPYVMEYNADPQPTRMGVYPSYTKPQSLQRYACIAKELGLTGNTDSELAAAFADRFMSLSAELGVPNNFKALGVDEAKFLSYIHEIACDAFDDQCSPANPRFPLIVELEELLKKSYYGGALKF